MHFHIITIFPGAFSSFLQTSIIGKAQDKGLLEVSLYKLNDFSPETSGHIDDKAYGMHGQVLRPEPLAKAIEYVYSGRGKIPTIYFTPRGETLSQELFEKFSDSDHQEYLLICGHYEGIDQRIIELYVDHQISLGEFVLTGGEIPAQVFVDGLTRLVPGVLGNELSHCEESYSRKLNRQKEYPLYTRPQIFEGKEVPKVLTSGNHKEIEKWKLDNLS